MLTYSYTALWFLYPFFAGCYTNITVNSCNTKRISSLEQSLSEKYVHIPGCQKNGEKWGLSHRNPEKSGHSYTFCWKKGGQSYTWQRWKRGLFGTHIHTMPYIGSYAPPPPPHETFYNVEVIIINGTLLCSSQTYYLSPNFYRIFLYNRLIRHSLWHNHFWFSYMFFSQYALLETDTIYL